MGDDHKSVSLTVEGDGAVREWLAERDVPCPRCGYNLRGIAGDRCPECGARLRVWLGEEAGESAGVWPSVRRWSRRPFVILGAALVGACLLFGPGLSGGLLLGLAALGCTLNFSAWLRRYVRAERLSVEQRQWRSFVAFVVSLAYGVGVLSVLGAVVAAVAT